MVWTETFKWLGFETTLYEGGYVHLKLFKGLSSDKEWHFKPNLVCKDRNEIIFNNGGLKWKKVVEESKKLSRKIVRTKVKGLTVGMNES
jgi:hypothetical protein